MSNHERKATALGVPSVTPMDLPMPPYRFQRDTSAASARLADGAMAVKATDILREANLLCCSASAARR